MIARPFVGDGPDNYVRTGNRRDLTTPPHSPTVLDKLAAAGGEVVSIGKIADIFAHQGITKKVKASGNAALFDATLTALAEAGDRSIVFTNFVDFDMLYGHRRDVPGYAAALEYFDGRLPELLAAMRPDDLLIITADHGCDPTWEGSDHTREHIPVIGFGPDVATGPIGRRETFADIGQSVAAHLGIAPLAAGITGYLFHPLPAGQRAAGNAGQITESAEKTTAGSARGRQAVERTSELIMRIQQDYISYHHRKKNDHDLRKIEVLRVKNTLSCNFHHATRKCGTNQNSYSSNYQDHP